MIYVGKDYKFFIEIPCDTTAQRTEIAKQLQYKNGEAVAEYNSTILLVYTDCTAVSDFVRGL